MHHYSFTLYILLNKHNTHSSLSDLTFTTGGLAYLIHWLFHARAGPASSPSDLFSLAHIWCLSIVIGAILSPPTLDKEISDSSSSLWQVVCSPIHPSITVLCVLGGWQMLPTSAVHLGAITTSEHLVSGRGTNLWNTCSSSEQKIPLREKGRFKCMYVITETWQ